MKKAGGIIAVFLVLLLSIQVFADTPVITGDSPSAPIVSAPMGVDNFVLLVTMICISAVALAVLLIASAVMKNKK